MDPTGDRLTRRSYLALGLVSAGMLAFEVGLSRLFAVQQFHHFAFMVVSLAVMGVSASGLGLTLLRRQPSLASLSLAYSFSVAVAYGITNRLPFDSYAIAWDRLQVWILISYFLAAGVPFLFAGWAAGLSLAQAGEGAHRPYAAVFIGSGLGAPAALLAHAQGGIPASIGLAATLGLAAAAVVGRRHVRAAAMALATLVVGLLVVRPSFLEPGLSPYKPLETARRSAGALVSMTRWDAATRLDVVEGGGTHAFPGLSLQPGAEVPPQVGFFLDGDGPLPVSALDPESPAARDLAERMPSELAHLLRPGARALILTPGGGLEVALALARGTDSVTVPTDEPAVVSTLRGSYSDYTGGLLFRRDLQLASRSTRGVLAGREATYEIVQFALSDPYRPVSSGAFSLSENYDLTVEALEAAYGSLTPDGLLVIDRWLGTPPSESARAWATLLAAMDRAGAESPSRRLIAFRNLRTMTLIASRSPLSSTELRTVRPFLEATGYDPVYLPDLEEGELNKHNRLPQPVYHELFSDLLHEREKTVAEYEFRLEPPTDDRPYFFHFFRWRQTPEVLARLGTQMQPFGGSGYLVLLALLALMGALALPLMLLPLAALRRRGLAGGGWRATAFFAALGAGYLLVEIPFISRLTLLLDRPAIALATVLFTIMAASGMGSLLSPRFDLSRSLGVLVAILALTLLALPGLVAAALPWGLGFRLALAVGVLLPAGVLMGIPFAAGLNRLERTSPGLIPWAWGVNGAASGLSGVIAAAVALDWGFSAVLVLGAAAYGVAFLTVPSANLEGQ